MRSYKRILVWEESFANKANFRNAKLLNIFQTYVFDVIKMQPEEVKADLEKLVKNNVHFLAIANKMDLNPYTKAEHYTNEILTKDQFIPISAIAKMNIEFLKEKLYNTVIANQLNSESTIVSNARHFDALQKAHDSLSDVLRGMDDGVTSDFIAMDIRKSLHYLGTITGQISTDDLLGNIFSNFCIGK